MAEPVVTAHRAVVASLTAPGGPFELELVDAGGRACRAYRHAPADLEAFFAGAEQRFGDRVLMVEEGRPYTYGELLAAGRRLAGSLRAEFGLRPGDRVGVAMRNRPEYLVALFAAARAGAVAVLFNGRAADSELCAAAGDVPCSVIVADETRAARLAASGVPLVVVREPGSAATAGADYADLAGPARPEAAATPAGRDAPAWVLFTSGTSGRAKGAVLTHRNVANMVGNLDFMRASALGLSARLHGVPAETIAAHAPPESALLVFPLFHVSGLTVLATAMLGGGTLVTIRRWDPDEATRLIVRHRVTSVSGPPLVLQDLLARPDALGGVVHLGVGGQATPANLATRIREVLPGVAQGGGWGMTETAGGVCAAAGPLAGARPGAAGWISPLMDVRAVDADGRPLPPGGRGELQVRGVLVMRGYWNRPEATARAFDGDWYRTGDVGHVDADGFVYVTDRMTDMVISGGENIYCAEVENALAATDHFAEVAVFGVPDTRLGERTVALVRTRDGVALTAEQVRALVGRTLADYKVPAEVVFARTAFPRTATGKVEKARLRGAYLAALDRA